MFYVIYIYIFTHTHTHTSVNGHMGAYHLFPSRQETRFFLAHAHPAMSRFMSVGGLVTSAARSQNRVPCLGRDKRAAPVTRRLTM